MKTRFTMCAVLAMCFAFMHPAFGEDAGALVSGANQALRSGDAGRAVSLYSAALQSPALAGRERAQALLNRGLAYERMGRHVEAVLDYTSAILLHVFTHEDLARAFLDRGIALDELGKANDALADYSAAIVVAPAFPAALNNRANLYRRYGKLENARRDYTASLVSGNTTPEFPLYGLGQIAEAEGDKGAAIGFYREAQAANPNFALAAQRLAALQGHAQLRGAPNQASPLRGPR